MRSCPLRQHVQNTLEVCALVHNLDGSTRRRQRRLSKTHPPERIREAHAAGLRLFGENRVQEFAGKAGALADLAGAEWHMIGHLQTNKAGKAAELFGAVDSVDSVKLAEKLNAAARTA